MIEKPFNVIKEEVVGVFASKDIKEWFKIVGPDGHLPQAYLIKSDAEKVCDNKNANFIDISEIKNQAHLKYEAKRKACLS